MEDDARASCPSTNTDSTSIAIVSKLLDEDRQMVREMEGVSGIQKIHK